MSDSAIWLLVADEESAQIYMSSEGSSCLLRSMRNESKVLVVGGAYACRDSCGDFAYEIMSALDAGAESGDCDGIVMFATKEMMSALGQFTPLSVSRLLIAEIVDPLHGASTQRRESAGKDVRLKLALTALPDYDDIDGSDCLGHTFTQAIARAH